jgi:hypothetical protein
MDPVISGHAKGALVGMMLLVVSLLLQFDSAPYVGTAALSGGTY